MNVFGNKVYMVWGIVCYRLKERHPQRIASYCPLSLLSLLITFDVIVFITYHLITCSHHYVSQESVKFSISHHNFIPWLFWGLPTLLHDAHSSHQQYLFSIHRGLCLICDPRSNLTHWRKDMKHLTYVNLLEPIWCFSDLGSIRAGIQVSLFQNTKCIWVAKIHKDNDINIESGWHHTSLVPCA